jgi:glycosyltransferase involved in cell wall biosynthesis
MAGGGAERQLTYLAKELAHTGWDVHVAVVHGGPNLKRLNATGATVHRLGIRGNHDPRILSRLVATIRRVRPDIVQCWLLQMEVLGGLASLLSRTPWVFSERASEEAYPATLKVWLRAKMGLLATAIVSNSEAGDRYWQARTRGRVRRCIIPNGLPLEEIASTPMASLEEAGVMTGAPIVLAAGRFAPQKNLETLVRALRLVMSERPAQAICCGDGPLRGLVERLVTESGLATRVHIVGYVSNLWSLMKRGSVMVSASWFEGSPNVVLEAMACGCPLVVSDISTHRELLDEEAAILVDPSNPRHIADAIIAVLRDPDAAAKRASVARARVQRYSLPAVAREYADLYREILTHDNRRFDQVAL